MIMVVLKYFWVNSTMLESLQPPWRKGDGWDGVLVSVPWGAGAERPRGGMRWLSHASPNTGLWSRGPAWSGGLFTAVVLKSFFRHRSKQAGYVP